MSSTSPIFGVSFPYGDRVGTMCIQIIDCDIEVLYYTIVTREVLVKWSDYHNSYVIIDKNTLEEDEEYEEDEQPFTVWLLPTRIM